MVIRLLADENFNGSIVRGLLLRHPNLDLLRVQDVGLSGANDPRILEWAADLSPNNLYEDGRANIDGVHDTVCNYAACE